ncbi:MAG TPA: hypothetical protein VFF69_04390 [Phycisphaerales bacterium]|nr:hypothetical protein [Phycisphaerales bacterium]
MTRSEANTTPEDLRPLAEGLAALGESSRREGAAVAERVAVRSTHALRGAAIAEPPLERIQRLLLWLAGPCAVLGAGALVVAALAPHRPQRPSAPSVETLAANLEHDIDAWLELDAAWSRDSFENDLAVLSLEAAGVALRDDEPTPLPAIDADS